MHATRVALRVPPPELHPMHAFVCESPSVDQQVILERDTRGDVATILLFVEGDRAEYEEVLATVDPVEEWTTEPTENGFYVHVRTQLRERERRYSEALNRESVLIVPPVTLRADRTVRQTMVGPAEELTAAIEALPDGVDIEVLHTGTYRHRDASRLTARQREALRAAWDCGFYDVPRNGDLAVVADELDCSTSTASDLLRRAGRRLVAAALDVDQRSK